MKTHPSKLLIFSELFYPSQTSTAYYLTKIAVHLSSVFDGAVHLFCATPASSAVPESELFPHNLQIHRVDDGRGNKNKLIQRLLKFIRISAKFTYMALTYAKKQDVVFAVTNPAFMIVLLAFLKKIIGFRYIILAYDIFPENMLVAGLSKQSSLAYRISKKIFDWGYCQADYVISIGRDMTEVLKGKGIAADKIVLLPNWASTEKITPCSKYGNPIVEKYKIGDSRIFMFAGNIGRVQGIPDILKVISEISVDNAAFLFVGDGAMKKELEQFQKEHPEKKLFCHPYLPMKEQNIFLNACDVAIVTLAKNMQGIGVPSKSYYSLASGHPILYIGDKKSEVALMLREAQCGWQVDPGDIEGCVRIIEKICTMPEQELQAMGQRARTYIEANGSEKIMLERYGDFFIQSVFKK